MRDITLSIINALLANSAIATALGTRVYRAQLPKKPTLPAIVVTKVDDIRPNDTNESYGRARIQVTVLAASDGLTDNISGMVADALNSVVNTYLTGVIIVAIEDAGAVSDNNPDSDTWMYHRDFMVNYL